MYTYRNLFHVYTQGSYHMYAKEPHYPHVHRDPIRNALKNCITFCIPIIHAPRDSITYMCTQGPPSCMHLENTTQMLSQVPCIFFSDFVIKYLP